VLEGLVILVQFEIDATLMERMVKEQMKIYRL